ncbi:MAG: DUF2281 domain-containing protein [Kiritimatiellia bacterium]|nr:DUF2281 domain-containing protein [Kiritimatiellia bacterium]
MTTAQAIAEQIETLPEAAKREVLDFVVFLESKTRTRGVPESGASWSAFSLASAMRGMEEEDSPYTVADMKESFR